MSEEKIYELKQDIFTPCYYIRAGKRATERQWKEKLGEFNMNWCSEWFIDTSIKNIQPEVDELNELINKVFDKNNLRSITYKDAAKKVAEIWLKQNQPK